MNKAERESFFKSFTLFFSALELLIALISYMEYNQDINKLDNEIFNEMKVCSFNLKCPKYEIDFEEKKEISLVSKFCTKALKFVKNNILLESVQKMNIYFAIHKSPVMVMTVW